VFYKTYLDKVQTAVKQDIENILKSPVKYPTSIDKAENEDDDFDKVVDEENG
jgi:hypothetical protein